MECSRFFSKLENLLTQTPTQMQKKQQRANHQASEIEREREQTFPKASVVCCSTMFYERTFCETVRSNELIRKKKRNRKNVALEANSNHQFNKQQINSITEQQSRNRSLFQIDSISPQKLRNNKYTNTYALKQARKDEEMKRLGVQQ